jgi:transcriptional regulator with XRE-family HTH domain
VQTVLRIRREAAGLSREALAREAAVSTSLVTLMERGYTCGHETAERIAQVLGCPVADVLHKTPLECVGGQR